MDRSYGRTTDLFKANTLTSLGRTTAPTDGPKKTPLTLFKKKF